MCREYIDVIASNIPQMKIKAITRFNIQRKPEKYWCLLEISPFRLFDHKKIPGLFHDFSKILAKSQDFPELSRTGGNHVFINGFTFKCIVPIKVFYRTLNRTSISILVIPDSPEMWWRKRDFKVNLSIYDMITTTTERLSNA